jgi:2-iminobutanoate/2-iminopropanoate deaminase
MAVRGKDRKIVRAKGSKPSGRPFSPAIEVGGRLYLSGMVGRGADGFGDGIKEQTRITLGNLEATLKAAGLSFDDVAEATVYLTDIRHYRAMNEIYAATFGSPPPARATVGTPLMSPDALVEIQMTATRRRTD